MNKDSHPSQLNNTQYTFAYNANLENESGSLLNLMNEKSNILAEKFQSGFVVHGVEVDPSTGNTLFFLVNPATGVGEFGEIKNNLNTNDLEDILISCKDCDYAMELAEPLETLVQTPLQTYETLISDEFAAYLDPITGSYTCYSRDDEEYFKYKLGFNFNKEFPIKSIVIKNEKTGKKIYFTDNYNTPRFIDYTNIASYLVNEQSCAPDEAVSCVNFERLRIFKLFNVPEIVPASIQIGGNLRLGVYEFLIAYCDAIGNEISPYYSITNPIPIFDKSNNILSQPNLADKTSFSIKLDINGLDKNYAFYKIAVIQTADIEGATRYYIEGIHNINDTSVSYSTEENKIATNIYNLLLPKLDVEKTESLEASNNVLFHTGITQKKEINLQPVVNLLGEFLQWQIHIAPETLYEDGIARSKYLGYSRDEVVPFSIRFGLRDGYETSLFPFIGRSPKDSDLVTLVNEDGSADNTKDTFKDVNSILESKQACQTSARTKTWQFYNTSYLDPINPTCEVDNIPTTDIEETLEKFCIMDSIPYTPTPTEGVLYSMPAGAITIEEGEDYLDLLTYINENKGYCPSFFVAPKVQFTAPNQDIIFCDFLEDTYAECTENPFAGLVDDDGNPICDTPEILSTDLEVSKVVGENIKVTNKIFPTEYAKITLPRYAVMYKKDTTTNNFVQDPLNPLGYNPDVALGTVSPIPVYLRESDFDNESCSYAKDIQTVTEMSPNDSKAYFNNYYFSNTSKELLSNKITNVVDYREEISFVEASIGIITAGTLKVKIGTTEFSQVYTTDPTTSASLFVTAHKTAIEALTGGVMTRSGAKIKITNATLAYVDSVTTTGTLEHLLETFGGFTKKLQKGALWFLLDFKADTELVLDLSQQRDPDGDDSIPVGSKVRISIFKSCTDANAIYSKIVDLDSSSLYKLKKSSATSLDLEIEDETTSTPIVITNGWNTSKRYYITVESPLVKKTIDTNPDGIESLGGIPPTYNLNQTLVDVFYTAPTKGFYTLTKRPPEIDKIDVEWDSIELVKKVKMKAVCTFKQPVVQTCKAFPYKKGEFAYWESTETYPDNNELYNSSLLTIKESDLSSLSFEDKAKFEETFTDGVGIDGKYIWRESEKIEGDVTSLQPVVDYTCRPIRHFKFPDNKVAPYIYNSQQPAFSSSIIFPLGVTISEEVILKFLDIAVNNGLLSLEDRANIKSYEIFRGDLTLNRSVVASGMLFDMRSYDEEENKNVLYTNYPFNSYSPDKFNLDSNNAAITNNTFGESNYNYTFHSPETDYYKPTLPTELSLQGFLFGSSKGNVEEVLEHPKWVILGDKAKKQASDLATLEVVAEALITLGQATVQSAPNYETSFFFFGGAGAAGGSTTMNPAGIGISLAGLAMIAIMKAATAIVYKWGRYRYEWMKIFRDLGAPNNFAYYYHAEGYYNYFRNSLHTNGDSLRSLNIANYIRDARYTTRNEITGDQLIINNIDREYSVFLSTGNAHKITYPEEYKNYDKNSDSSLTYLGENGIISVKRSPEIRKNIASPYVHLKEYVPSQHGTINSVKWMPTGFRSDFNNTGCLSIFGGDTYISRHTVKRKKPQFSVTAMKQADLTPFNYYFYNSIGNNPRFYVSYELNKDFSKDGQVMPDISYDYSFDNDRSNNSSYWNDIFGKSEKYVSPPNKFYLYFYGVPNYLVETRINTNYRYAGKELRDNFFPQVGDLSRWTQERNVPINEPETFNYHNTYSKQTTFIRTRVFPDIYKKEINDKTQNLPNGIIASLPDSSENSIVDPWLIYRPFNLFEFPTNYGKLKDIIDVESQTVLARFEDTSMLYNKVDSKVDDGTAPTSAFFGGTSLWQRRPITFSNTDLGHGGTQNFAKVSCEHGHFWVDAKRGQVLTIQPNGGTIEEISSVIGGKPSGMRNWFKEHLPFKILKKIPNADTDNPYNGVGIIMGWDSRHRRVFITKKDYIPKDCVEYIEGRGYFYNATKCGATPICPEGFTYNTITKKCEKPDDVFFRMYATSVTKIENVDVTSNGDFTVDWGDGSIEVYERTDFSSDSMFISHTYSTPYTGEVRLTSGLSIITRLLIKQNDVSGTELRVKLEELVKLPALTSFQNGSNKGYVEGSLTQIPNSVIYFDASCSNNISGNLADIKSGLENILIQGQNTITGNLSSLTDNTNLNDFSIYGFNTISGNLLSIKDISLASLDIGGYNTVTGNIADLNVSYSVNLEGFNTVTGNFSSISSLPIVGLTILGMNTTTGNINDLPKTARFITLSGSSVLTGNIANMPPNTVFFSAKGGDTLIGDVGITPVTLERLTLGTGHAVSGYTTKVWKNTMRQIVLTPALGGLDSSEVDQLLIDLSNVTTWVDQKQVAITGTNAPRTAVSNAAVVLLESKGVTVTTN